MQILPALKHAHSTRPISTTTTIILMMRLALATATRTRTRNTFARFLYEYRRFTVRPTLSLIEDHCSLAYAPSRLESLNAGTASEPRINATVPFRSETMPSLAQPARGLQINGAAQAEQSTGDAPAQNASQNPQGDECMAVLCKAIPFREPTELEHLRIGYSNSRIQRSSCRCSTAPRACDGHTSGLE